jgi:aldose 1-epimerase
MLDQELMLAASKYTPSKPVENADPVPDGSVQPVKGTPFDFTSSKPIGKDLQAAGGNPAGFDHNWIIDGQPGTMRLAARAKDPKTGRVLTLETDQPGIQFYTGKFLDGSITGKGATYARYAGFCLETQSFPNAINVPAWKSQVVLEPGQTYQHSMIYRFTVE